MRGFVRTSQSTEDLITAVRAAMKGGTCFAPDLVAQLADTAAVTGETTAPRPRMDSLTDREIEVLRHLGQGLSQKAIAEALRLKVKTVNSHCLRIMNKLDIHDRVLLVRCAIREGIVPP